MNILKLRGFLGLYAGFRIHIGKVIGMEVTTRWLISLF